MVELSVFLWLAVTLLLLYRFYLNNIKRPPNFPPGPPRMPFFEDYGLVMLLNYRHPHRGAAKLANFYKTKILGLSLVGNLTIVVRDLAVARELMNRPEFDGRPNLFLVLMRQEQFKRRGIFFTEGSAWKEQRNFFLNHLRDYGFGKRSELYEQEVRSELEHFVDLLTTGPLYEYERDFIRDEDGFVKCPNVFFVMLSNIFLQLMIGERYHRGRAKSLVKAAQNGLQFACNADDYGTIYSFFPWIRYVFPFTPRYNRIRGGILGLSRFMEGLIARQKQTLDPNNPRNIVHRYLCEIPKHIPQDVDFTFQHDQLVTALADFYLPAVSGMSFQLSMLIERLLLNPEVMKRMQHEIDDNVEQDRLPTLDDRINLPYTEATIRECLRIDNLIPSGIVHRTMQNTTLSGYSIPENTLVLIDFDEINNDPDVWGDPYTFRPERFLDDDTGKLVLSKDRTLSFGAGKRVCFGQTHARNTMFLILATLMHRFDLRQRTTDPLPDLSKRRTAFIHGPDAFWVHFVPRQKQKRQTITRI